MWWSGASVQPASPARGSAVQGQQLKAKGSNTWVWWPVQLDSRRKPVRSWTSLKKADLWMTGAGTKTQPAEIWAARMLMHEVDATKFRSSGAANDATDFTHGTTKIVVQEIRSIQEKPQDTFMATTKTMVLLDADLVGGLHDVIPKCLFDTMAKNYTIVQGNWNAVKKLFRMLSDGCEDKYVPACFPVYHWNSAGMSHKGSAGMFQTDYVLFITPTPTWQPGLCFVSSVYVSHCTTRAGQ